MSTEMSSESLILQAPSGGLEPRSMLLELPAEIRLMVWKFVFSGASLTINKALDYQHLTVILNVVYSQGVLANRFPPHPLCQVNRQTYNETIDVFYQETIIKMDHDVLARLLTPMDTYLHRPPYTSDSEDSDFVLRYIRSLATYHDAISEPRVRLDRHRVDVPDRMPESSTLTANMEAKHAY